MTDLERVWFVVGFQSGVWSAAWRLNSTDLSRSHHEYLEEVLINDVTVGRIVDMTTYFYREDEANVLQPLYAVVYMIAESLEGYDANRSEIDETEQENDRHWKL